MNAPKGWERLPIKNVYKGLFDGPHATPPVADEGPVFLGIKNITDDGHLVLNDVRHIAEQDFARWTKRVTPQAGDIVFTYEATLNRYARIPEDFRGCLGRRLALIRPNEEVVDPRFLHFYFFGQDWRETIEANKLSGATVDRIPLTDFPNFPINLPPLPVQKRIASILSAYDDLIENNTRRIAILEEMAQRLYEEWFVHFRFPGHEDATFIETADGRVPEGWEYKLLRDVIELAYGKALKAADREEGPYPVYGSSGIVGTHKDYLVEGPGIILGRKGNVGSVHWTEKSFFPIDTVYYVKTELPLEYVFFNLQNQNFLNNDAAVPGLNRNQAYALTFLKPSDELLKKFTLHCKPLYDLVRKLRSKNENLSTQRDLLLPKLVSGEIDVIEAENNLENAVA